MQFSHLSGTALARLIKQRKVSIVEVMSQTLQRAETVQANCNPFVTLVPDEALAHAKLLDVQLEYAPPQSLPPLFGVPFTVKDLLDTKDVRTTYGSRALECNVPENDVVAVARMREAGAILIGKTTTPEFAGKVLTDSALCGATRNPWAPTLTAGGSSGGAGVVAATGVASLSVSTDGGGSSRIPASACGVLGLKVTMGGIPHESWPFHFGNNSSISMNCRHPEDLATLFNVMSGSHRLDPWSRRETLPIAMPLDAAQAVHGKRGLFVPALGGNECDLEYKIIVECSLKKLAALGLNIDVANDDPTHFDPDSATQMMACNLAARLRELPKHSQVLLGPALQSLLDAEHFTLDGVGLQADAMERSRLYDRVEQILGTYDFIFSPTLTAPPPLADPQGDQRVTVNGDKLNLKKWWSHLSLANLTGHPAISIPCGIDENKLPVGLHAIAGWDQEQDLLSLASAVAIFDDWTERWPQHC